MRADEDRPGVNPAGYWLKDGEPSSCCPAREGFCIEHVAFMPVRIEFPCGGLSFLCGEEFAREIDRPWIKSARRLIIGLVAKGR